ncbi:MAG: hypothetical protein EAZ60_08005 [Oscillatoriales cyanobacterium]|uniref:hypothetical protein n=1 Tax=unclassified Microcoleus TaxID=2642155 RepID=UPI001D819F94|nr:MULTISPECIES: hypothetical protein [unclassified Microcoleus]MCC3459156.1 hypothetical protein [Microcoleus sp. PH2017_11_PCY_U_A]MCC3477335.1 hypothetical protein [Microcoleus sp. PH2017_12_PCY_D_A]TAE84629.1 MAG: hypothetical protein EAZ83_05390 [Oscillatoriales cyanobacterium]MCC3558408.1 hypothetical protein [Microcoleus sp. PH2017_27_LUM_O_A]TAE93476.1 MAG: hypothetical protein EAZ79_27475 [Oscillatoriales cyanobacterium]
MLPDIGQVSDAENLRLIFAPGRFCRNTAAIGCQASGVASLLRRTPADNRFPICDRQKKIFS